MPRTGWVKPAQDHRLSDHLAWGLLTRVFPPDVVDLAVADSGRVQQRERMLPSRLVVYYVMGLALFSQSSYEEVMRMLVAGQEWAAGDAWADSRPAPSIPTKAALFKARTRLGAEPLERLFARVAVPLAAAATGTAATDRPGFHRDLRLLSIDRTALDVPDTPANNDAFNRPIVPQVLPLPQVPVVGLTEVATSAIVDAVVGGAAAPQQDDPLVGMLAKLPADTLVLGGAELFSSSRWSIAAATGAQLLWTIPPDVALERGERLADDSYTAAIGKANTEVRIIDVGADAGRSIPSRLATTLLDPVHSPADELAALHGGPGSIAAAFDELRAHPRSPRVVLRSKVPDGVRQEVYGYLCVHYAIRWLLAGGPDLRR